MNSRMHDRLQTIGLIGVIVGLVLVAFEVRQANTFAQAEAIRSMYESWDNIQVTAFESDFYDIYTKSFEDPEGLTDSEMMQMDAWLTANMNQYAKQLDMQEMGLYPYDPVADLIGNFDFFFGGAFARAWYPESARWWMDPAIVEAIDQEMNSREILTAPKLPERIRARIEKGDNSP